MKSDPASSPEGTLVNAKLKMMKGHRASTIFAGMDAACLTHRRPRSAAVASGGAPLECRNRLDFDQKILLDEPIDYQ
jgi:hypothetical protein